MNDLLQRLETYYDAAPRPNARTEEVGPFTLFVRTDPASHPYYARPRLTPDGAPFPDAITGSDVAAVRARQREIGVPEAIEWVHQNTPSLLDAARADGLAVAECPLLVHAAVSGSVSSAARVQVLAADSPDLGAVAAAIGAGFRGVDDVESQAPGGLSDALRSGTLVMVGAYDEHGAVVGGGSHSPRGSVTELTGIAVLPRARRRGAGAALTAALVADAHRRGVETVFLSAQDDTVARVYERVGFVRVGTACIAEAPPTPAPAAEPETP